MYDQAVGAPGKTNSRWGGFLDDVDLFDPLFFDISPRETAQVDPQQRLLLEVAYEALTDAGQPLRELRGSRVGVYVGVTSSDYGRMALARPTALDAYSATGGLNAIAANRLSYAFDFCGPSVVVDTACSASLVAVHMACQGLHTGDATLALAGGVNLILSPENTIALGKLGALSPEGRCKAFDAGANGFVRSEGVGVVVLKPLAQALADGDRIYAVIRGSAVNQDGRSNGLTAPSRTAQERVLRSAYQRASVRPSEVQYVEAHGTGTALGDAIELRALATVLGEGGERSAPCTVGLVKTNIGHPESAAGIAGLIEVALALQHRGIPPNLHFREPAAELQGAPLRVPTSLTPWTAEGARVAGVSSFGIGGTNAHVVLSAAPERTDAATAPSQTYLLPISARTGEALAATARAYASFLSTEADLDAVCFTAGARRDHAERRAGIVAASRAELVERVSSLARSEPAPGVHTAQLGGKRAKVAFVYSGQGAQWLGMGREALARIDTFRAAFRRCSEAFRELGTPSLEELLNLEDPSRFDEPGVAGPLLFAVQTGIAALFESAGVSPDAVVGHSLGEIAAAHGARRIGLEDACRIVVRRSAVLARVPGRMLFVGLPADETSRELAPDRAWVASINGPNATVLSGDGEALGELAARLESRGVFCRWVPVNAAGHSPWIRPPSARVPRLARGRGRPRVAHRFHLHRDRHVHARRTARTRVLGQEPARARAVRPRDPEPPRRRFQRLLGGGPPAGVARSDPRARRPAST